MTQLEVGKTYKNGYGAKVRIVADDRDDPHGFRFVGLHSLCGSSESAHCYNAEGLWQGDTSNREARLFLPRRYIALDDALSLIRSREDKLALAVMGLIIGDLEAMPFKELSDA